MARCSSNESVPALGRERGKVTTLVVSAWNPLDESLAFHSIDLVRETTTRGESRLGELAHSHSTIIVAGTYRVSATSDRGFDGMLQTIDYLVARERASASARPATAPAAAPKPAPAR